MRGYVKQALEELKHIFTNKHHHYASRMVLSTLRSTRPDDEGSSKDAKSLMRTLSNTSKNTNTSKQKTPLDYLSTNSTISHSHGVLITLRSSSLHKQR